LGDVKIGPVEVQLLLLQVGHGTDDHAPDCIRTPRYL
jgi:hypothetical protein